MRERVRDLYAFKDLRARTFEVYTRPWAIFNDCWNHEKDFDRYTNIYCSFDVELRCDNDRACDTGLLKIWEQAPLEYESLRVLHVDWLICVSHNAESFRNQRSILSWVEKQQKRVWAWAGKCLRLRDLHWKSRVLTWCLSGSCYVGRPAERWRDHLDTKPLLRKTSSCGSHRALSFASFTRLGLDRSYPLWASYIFVYIYMWIEMYIYICIYTLCLYICYIYNVHKFSWICYI